ncbi:hypothetical protein F0562_016276 [Nyssa sinensis]|uniref:DC1 domain-containing protein n=1 Tax=Nyssa sinensis TaxID=561372 RepID=A0A5J4ZJU5_9ASTE|nr:hypothetical protein F0562_016276 [Nyssa sinensis]
MVARPLDWEGDIGAMAVILICTSTAGLAQEASHPSCTHTHSAWCKDCEFDVHPLCTQLPQHLRHVLHPVHPLTLQTSSSSWCAVCRGACPSWRYRCGVCGFDIHLECVLTPCVPPTQRTPPPPPPPPHYAAYTPNPYMYNCVNQAQRGGAANGRSGKMMYSLAGKLALGVISNMIFGMPNMDFSSFI